MSDREMMLRDVLMEIRPYSMVPDEGLLHTWARALELIESELPGVFIECGTWRGGCSFGLALAQQRAFGAVVRPVYMLDNFEGLAPAGDRDGPAAREWQSATEAETYFDNCRADFDAVLVIRDTLGLTEGQCRLIKGWFSDTVPLIMPQLAQEGIALLRIDCDWYEPFRFVLEQLEPLVNEEGVVIVDDYYAWDGAARAVHDYLSTHDLPYRLRQIGYPIPSAAWFTKRKARRLTEPL